MPRHRRQIRPGAMDFNVRYLRGSRPKPRIHQTLRRGAGPCLVSRRRSGHASLPRLTKSAQVARLSGYPIRAKPRAVIPKTACGSAICLTSIALIQMPTLMKGGEYKAAVAKRLLAINTLTCMHLRGAGTAPFCFGCRNRTTFVPLNCQAYWLISIQRSCSRSPAGGIKVRTRHSFSRPVE